MEEENIENNGELLSDDNFSKDNKDQTKKKEKKRDVWLRRGEKERMHGDSILSVGGSRIYSMKGHLRLRKNLRKSITERSGDLVLLAGREEASGPPFPAR